AHKHCIATLNVGFDISSAEVAQNGNKLFHRQCILPTDVDATEKRNIDLHLIIASNPESRTASNDRVEGGRRLSDSADLKAAAAPVQRAVRRYAFIHLFENKYP